MACRTGTTVTEMELMSDGTAVAVGEVERDEEVAVGGEMGGGGGGGG